MKCYSCNANCRNGSYKCWNCGRVFKRRPYVKNVNIQKNYYQERNDNNSGNGVGAVLGLAAAIGGLLYLTRDED